MRVNLAAIDGARNVRLSRRRGYSNGTRVKVLTSLLSTRGPCTHVTRILTVKELTVSRR